MAEKTVKATAQGQATVQAKAQVQEIDPLLAAAQKKAPHLTAEFCDKHELSDEYLQGIADGLIPPPPMAGPGVSQRFSGGAWTSVQDGHSHSEPANSGYGPLA
jgi:hypothetical protein